MWLAKARAEYRLDKKIALLQKALSYKNVAQTQSLLQAAMAKRQRIPDAGHILTNSIKMQLVFIPQGEFTMGSPSNEVNHSADEEPQHQVIISEGFYMGVYEVSQWQYTTIMEKNPSQHKHFLKLKKMPVETVLWDEAMQFCSKLSQKEGRTYRLPTEAEWEYACRARTAAPYNTGEALNVDQANYFSSKELREAAIGCFSPNRFGLYDMHGNLAEWCSDWYDPVYYRKGENDNPQGPSKGNERIVRGGHFWSGPQECRSACRGRRDPNKGDPLVGFRVVLEVP